MRSEWDRRVAHDYRYWMSDGVASDEEMWRVGQRDFDLITQGLSFEDPANLTALEIGCGVGRLLRAAAARFGSVVGVDVSEQAVKEAKRLLADQARIAVVLGNGSDLSAIPSGAIDFVYSFAALCSMPAQIMAAYLVEAARVLKAGGTARLQVYIGKPQEIAQEDTLSLRSFERTFFENACQAAGFEVVSIGELVLPFEISDKDAGVVASVATLVKRTVTHMTASAVADLLLPGGEAQLGQQWIGSETEYFMALARARQHLDAGRVGAAKEALEFAVSYYAHAETEVKELLEDLNKQINGSTVAMVRDAQMVSSAPAAQTIIASSGGEIYQKNLAVLTSQFPNVAKALAAVESDGEFVAKHNSQGQPVFSYKGFSLIHEEKPQRAAEVWVEQTLNHPRAKEAPELLLAGFGAGYQLEELVRRTNKKLHVYEARADLLKGVLRHKDCRAIFDSLSSLSVSIPEIEGLIKPQLEQGHVELIELPQSKVIALDAVEALRRVMLSARGMAQLHPRIGVVGPMYGGSLPIARYTARALSGLKQRVYGYDLSSFYDGFRGIGGFLKNQSRKDMLENQYVEVLSQAVLEGVTERPVDILICLAQAPMTPKVLTELRQRGIITVMWFVEDCSRFQTWKYIAPYFDYMFIIQREFTTAVRDAGAGRAIYLPVGCDPDIHRPVDLTPEERIRYGSEISFLGAGYNNRRHMFAHLANRDFKIWGTEWPDCMPFSKMVQEQGRRLDPEEYNKIFNASTVNLNLHSSMERDGVEPFGDFINPRTFELAAAGAFQLVDERTLLAEQFHIGPEMAVFHDGHEMHERIDHYIAHPEERAAIIRASRARALGEHTYQHRLKAMMEHIYADQFERLQARTNTGQWALTLGAAKEFPELEKKMQEVYQRGDEPQLDALIDGVTAGKGQLSEFEQKLLFLHHIRSQTTTIQTMRNEKQ